MRTIKEVAELTGISVRTLHYYDEIGLFRPTKVSEAGYRLYDDKALEILQQILFFREFDIPLKEIRAIMDDPALDRTRLLKSQKQMLEAKKARLERLISGIDDILKGEDKMDFEMFSKNDIETLYESMVSNMSELQRAVLTEEYGDMDAFHRHYMEQASGGQAQENFRKAVEWYGDKESAMKAAAQAPGEEVLSSYQNRLDAVMKKLAGKRGMDVSLFEVKEIIGEYDFVSKQLYQMKDVKGLVRDLASAYKNDERMKAALDGQYGAGTAEYFAEAVEEFYREK